jgi:hypothetical protein
MAEHDSSLLTPPPASSRFRWGLWGAPLAVMVLCVVWSVAWFIVRARTVENLDLWMAQQASLGNTWTCPNRSVTGFPFRLEISCDAPRLAQANGRVLDIAALRIVTQIYFPRHHIVDARAPLVVRQNDQTFRLNWSDAVWSIRHRTENDLPILERTSLRLENAELQWLDQTFGRARLVETHVRKDPQREDAYNLAVTSQGVEAAVLDAALRPLFGFPQSGVKPLDVTLQSVMTRVPVQARFGREAVVAWRTRGGIIELQSLTLARDTQLARVQGTLGLDDKNRPSGELTLQGENLEGSIAQVLPRQSQTKTMPAVITLKDGRLRFGGIPLLPLPALPFISER